MPDILKALETLSNDDLLRLIARAGEILQQRQQAEPPPDEEFEQLPFFGMHADREDMEDSVAWVRRERERWHERLTREE